MPPLPIERISIAGWPFSLQKSQLTLTGEKDSERQKCFKSKHLHALGEISPHQCGKVHHYWVCLQRSTARGTVVTKKNSNNRKLTSFKSHGVLLPRLKCLPSSDFTCANFFFHTYTLSHPSLGAFLSPKANAVCLEEKCHLQPARKAPKGKTALKAIGLPPFGWE